MELIYSNRACVLKTMFGVQLTAVQSASESLQRVSNAMAIESHRRRRCDTYTASSSLCAMAIAREFHLCAWPVVC